MFDNGGDLQKCAEVLPWDVSKRARLAAQSPQTLGLHKKGGGECKYLDVSSCPESADARVQHRLLGGCAFCCWEYVPRVLGC